jgi:hypothetical protein
MRKLNGILLLLLLAPVSIHAGGKQKGTTTLQDIQPAGTDKDHKRQQFDLYFDASGTRYTCRTKDDAKLKATEWPVRTDIDYEIDKEKAKIKTRQGKKVECTIVRVEAHSDTAQTSPK